MPPELSPQITVKRSSTLTSSERPNIYTERSGRAYHGLWGRGAMGTSFVGTPHTPHVTLMIDDASKTEDVRRSRPVIAGDRLQLHHASSTRALAPQHSHSHGLFSPSSVPHRLRSPSVVKVNRTLFPEATPPTPIPAPSEPVQIATSSGPQVYSSAPSNTPFALFARASDPNFQLNLTGKRSGEMSMDERSAERGKKATEVEDGGEEEKLSILDSPSSLFLFDDIRVKIPLFPFFFA